MCVQIKCWWDFAYNDTGICNFSLEFFFWFDWAGDEIILNFTWFMVYKYRVKLCLHLLMNSLFTCYLYRYEQEIAAAAAQPLPDDDDDAFD